MEVRPANARELEVWDDLVVTPGGGHVYQSMAWARHRAAAGWRPHHLVAADGSAALALERPWPLIGGGSAYLEMNDNALLETGVGVMARPPGKRNSTIHLLSGGEKALTAVAMVFSIFELNPSPFCMLDEVDAPLDDVNVTRFNRLIQNMTEHSQFIIITHNKRTMEVADRLFGVTMEEAGVSKIVSVNLSGAA